MLGIGAVDFDTAGTDDSDFTFRGVVDPEGIAHGSTTPRTRRSSRSSAPPCETEGTVRLSPTCCARRTACPLDAGGGFSGVGLVGALPREVLVLAAEVAVGGGLLVDRPVQVQLLAEGAGAQVEVLGDELGDLARGRSFSVPNVSTITETGCATPIA